MRATTLDVPRVSVSGALKCLARLRAYERVRAFTARTSAHCQVVENMAQHHYSAKWSLANNRASASTLQAFRELWGLRVEQVAGGAGLSSGASR